MKDYRNHALKLSSEDNKFSIKKTINNFLRDKFDIYYYKDLIPFRYWMYYTEKIRPIWSPAHTRIRKAVPRKWMDLSSIIKDVNFEIIKSFYEEEYLNGVVDWEQSGPSHIEFSVWLEEAYRYVTEERLMLEKQMDDAYPPSRPIDAWFEETEETFKGKKLYKFKPSNADYSEVNRLEQLIEEKDTEILSTLIKYRGFFWT
jgi:hypothetical protein